MTFILIKIFLGDKKKKQESPLLPNIIKTKSCMCALNDDMLVFSFI